MGKHPELQSDKFSATFTFKHAHKLWEEVTEKLHEIPGAIKEWKQWRKVCIHTLIHIMTSAQKYLYLTKFTQQ